MDGWALFTYNIWVCAGGNNVCNTTACFVLLCSDLSGFLRTTKKIVGWRLWGDSKSSVAHANVVRSEWYGMGSIWCGVRVFSV